MLAFSNLGSPDMGTTNPRILENNNLGPIGIYGAKYYLKKRLFIHFTSYGFGIIKLYSTDTDAHENTKKKYQFASKTIMEIKALNLFSYWRKPQDGAKGLHFPIPDPYFLKDHQNTVARLNSRKSCEIVYDSLRIFGSILSC